jgi:hypothetical protein
MAPKPTKIVAPSSLVPQVEDGLCGGVLLASGGVGIAVYATPAVSVKSKSRVTV